MKRKTENDKFALVIWSALREWGLTPTMDECKESIIFLKEKMADRAMHQLPQTYREPTQTKG